MYTIGVILIALGVVSADVGLGYHYKVPHTSYGVPSYQTGGNSGYSGSSGSDIIYKGQPSQAIHIGSTVAPSTLTDASSVHLGPIYAPQGFSSHGVVQPQSQFGSTYAPQSSSTYQLGGIQAGSGLGGAGGGYYQSATNAAGSNVGNIGYGLNGQQTYNQYQTSNQYQTQQKYHQYYQVQQQPAQVFKHFYVHSAPEEPEPARPRQPIVLPPPQKHYKVIFVKAPSQSTHTSQIVQVPQQNEEKTIVYVLVKKPEEHQDVIVPKVEQKPPTKPEVYYIKYNNKQDSQAVINNIVKDFNKGGQPVTFSGSGHYDASGVSSGPSALGSSGYVTAPSTVGTSGFHSVPSVGGSTGFVSSYPSIPSTVGSTGFHSGHPLNIGSNIHQTTFGHQADSPVEINDSTHTFGTNTYDDTNGSPGTSSFSVATVDNDDSLSSNIYSTAAPSISTSTIEYDSVNTISSSQGIPHETYGPPKFRKD